MAELPVNVNWDEPIEWNDGTPAKVSYKRSGHVEGWHTISVKPGFGDNTESSVWAINGTTTINNFNKPHIRNVQKKEEIVHEEKISLLTDLSDTELADSLRVLLNKAEEIERVLIDRGYVLSLPNKGEVHVANDVIITKEVVTTVEI